MLGSMQKPGTPEIFFWRHRVRQMMVKEENTLSPLCCHPYFHT